MIISVDNRVPIKGWNYKLDTVTEAVVRAPCVTYAEAPAELGISMVVRRASQTNLDAAPLNCEHLRVRAQSLLTSALGHLGITAVDWQKAGLQGLTPVHREGKNALI